MYLINKEENTISKVQERTFTQLGFKERKHLQEWIEKNPECLEKDLLIIQKEFNGFNDTNERLDLLALDKDGNLVIIENKLDDSGRDTVWQSLKYSSYCSTLKKDQIKDIYQEYLSKNNKDENAEEKLVEFFDNIDYKEIILNQGQSQRIILVAREFRKEVTSTALWLMNYKLKIKCVKVTPYQLDEQLFLDIEQIIPVKESEDYIISMLDKESENSESQEQLKDRHKIRIEFWKEILKRLNEKTQLFQNISPSKDNWLAAGSSVSGISYELVISSYYCRADVYIGRPSKEENKLIFDDLYLRKNEIEAKFGQALEWERLEDKKAARVKYEIKDVDVFNKDNWEKMMRFMIDAMVRMENSFRDEMKMIANKLKNK
ncbi:MAG TPA: hypothetical protein DCP90_08445 [Clostridiales bacterium]|nr:MAG: hypothetical protein A2Y22_08315 [Clostridiales bacterium GWD2_32_59]HAN10622.1 hypothetical protein [Clostridiales bacterium]